jgi:hypothetical protein
MVCAFDVGVGGMIPTSNCPQDKITMNNVPNMTMSCRLTLGFIDIPPIAIVR